MKVGSCHLRVRNSSACTSSLLPTLTPARGVQCNAGEPITVKPKELPLAQFDAIFRKAGNGVVFISWAMRAVPTFVLANGDERNTLWVPLGLHCLAAIAR